MYMVSLKLEIKILLIYSASDFINKHSLTDAENSKKPD
jgi:hypothetical protein